MSWGEREEGSWGVREQRSWGERGQGSWGEREEGSEGERDAARCRATCYEADGQVREILITGDQAGEILELHLMGFNKMELECADDEQGPDTDLFREWE